MVDGDYELERMQKGYELGSCRMEYQLRNNIARLATMHIGNHGALYIIMKHTSNTLCTKYLAYKHHGYQENNDATYNSLQEAQDQAFVWTSPVAVPHILDSGCGCGGVVQSRQCQWNG